MQFGIIERGGLFVGVWLHGAEDPIQADWDRACDALLRFGEKEPGAFAKLRNLVITDGGAPNMKQRTRLNVGVFGGSGVRTVALTQALANPIKRGLVQAITWTNPSFKALGPGQWAEGLEHLGIGGDTEIFFDAARLESPTAKPIETLAQIKTLIRSR